MKEVIKVLDAGATPANSDLMFIKDMDGKWYKYKMTDECKTYADAIAQNKREEVSDSYAKSHIWPLSYGRGSLRVVFGIEIVGEDARTHNEIKHV